MKRNCHALILFVAITGIGACSLLTPKSPSSPVPSGAPSAASVDLLPARSAALSNSPLASASASSALPPDQPEASCNPIAGRPRAAGCPEISTDSIHDDSSASLEGDDSLDFEEEEEAPKTVVPHPFAQLSDAEFASKLRRNPAEFGPMSIGFPNQGRLFNGVQMPLSDHYFLSAPSAAWGTQETVDYLTLAFDKVFSQFPQSPKVILGHISARNGGPLIPHVSHQAGRDIDIGYYHTTEQAWFMPANARNLDLERTWFFVRTLLRETPIDLIIIDHSIQRLLREYAVASGEDRDWVNGVFDGIPAKDGVLGKRAQMLHVHGHHDHMHVRFFNPIAQETGRRAAPTLLTMGLVRPPTTARPAATSTTFPHRVNRGETLGLIAKKYGITVVQIRAVNGFLSNHIKPGQVIKIPGKPPAVRGHGGANSSAKPPAAGKSAVPGKASGKPTAPGKASAPGKSPALPALPPLPAPGKAPAKAPGKGSHHP